MGFHALPLILALGSSGALGAPTGDELRITRGRQLDRPLSAEDAQHVRACGRALGGATAPKVPPPNGVPSLVSEYDTACANLGTAVGTWVADPLVDPWWKDALGLLATCPKSGKASFDEDLDAWSSALKVIKRRLEEPASDRLAPLPVGVERDLSASTAKVAKKAAAYQARKALTAQPQKACEDEDNPGDELLDVLFGDARYSALPDLVVFFPEDGEPVGTLTQYNRDGLTMLRGDKALYVVVVSERRLVDTSAGGDAAKVDVAAQIEPVHAPESLGKLDLGSLVGLFVPKEPLDDHEAPHIEDKNQTLKRVSAKDAVPLYLAVAHVELKRGSLNRVSVDPKKPLEPSLWYVLENRRSAIFGIGIGIGLKLQDRVYSGTYTQRIEGDGDDAVRTATWDDDYQLVSAFDTSGSFLGTPAGAHALLYFRPQRFVPRGSEPRLFFWDAAFFMGLLAHDKILSDPAKQVLFGVRAPLPIPGRNHPWTRFGVYAAWAHERRVDGALTCLESVDLEGGGTGTQACESADPGAVRSEQRKASRRGWDGSVVGIDFEF